MSTNTKITDLAELDTVKGADEGHEFELRHPATSEPLGAYITVVGTDSERYQQQIRALQKKSMEQLTRQRRLNAVDPEQEGIELLAASTLGWRDLPPVDGKSLDFSLENARALYRRFPWIREQVSAVIQERANFLPKPASGS